MNKQAILFPFLLTVNMTTIISIKISLPSSLATTPSALWQRPSKTSYGELTMKFGNLTVRGKSTGGRETCMIIEELSIAFDMGYQPALIEKLRNIYFPRSY